MNATSAVPRNHAIVVAVEKRRLLYASFQMTSESTFVASPGPPKVRRKIYPIPWNAAMNAPTKLITMSGMSCGSVTCRKRAKMPAPSIAAAS